MRHPTVDRRQGSQRDVVYLGSWLTNSSCVLHIGAQIKFGDLTPYLIYAKKILMYASVPSQIAVNKGSICKNDSYKNEVYSHKRRREQDQRKVGRKSRPVEM